MFTLTCVAVITFLFFRTLARNLELEPTVAVALGAAVTIPLVFQPLMNELIAWPVLFFHLNWIFFTFLSGYSLLRFVSDSPKAIWAWVAALSGYFTMNCYGIGFAVSLSVIATLAGLAIATKYDRFHQLLHLAGAIRSAALVAALLTFLHFMAMCFLPIANNPTEVGTRFFGLGQLLGLFAFYPAAVIMALFGITPFPYVNREAFADPAIFGLLFALGSAVAVWRIGRQWWSNDTCANRSLLIALFFCVGIATVSIVMMGARMVTEPAALGSYGFLIGPRYLVPLSFPCLGIFFALIVRYGKHLHPRSAIILSFLLLIASLGNHFAYDRNVYLRTAQLHGSPEPATWRAVVAATREAREAHHPMPNVPVEFLMEDWRGFRLQFFEPILRHDLNLTGDDEIFFTETMPSNSSLDYRPRLKDLQAIMTTYTPHHIE